MEEKTLDREITLQDKVDVAWDFLLDVNPRMKQKEFSPLEKMKIDTFIKDLKNKGKSNRFIKRAVRSKYNINIQ